MNQVTVIQIEGTVQWRAFRDPSTRTWIGTCEPLKLTARGESWGELATDIDDVIQTLFTDLVHEGEQTFVAFLRSHGWSPQGAIPRNVSDVRFDIPTPIEHVANAG